jgi:hypothetical protein
MTEWAGNSHCFGHFRYWGLSRHGVLTSVALPVNLRARQPGSEERDMAAQLLHADPVLLLASRLFMADWRHRTKKLHTAVAER